MYLYVILSAASSWYTPKRKQSNHLSAPHSLAAMLTLKHAFKIRSTTKQM